MAHISSLRYLMDHVRKCAETSEGTVPHKYECWGTFFPEIQAPERGGYGLKNPDSKCSRFIQKDSNELCEKLRANATCLLTDSGVTLPEPLRSVTEDINEVCWYVRWAIRSLSSPYREQLLTEELMASNFREDKKDPTVVTCVDLFDDEFLGQYLSRLQADWALSDERVDSFRGHVYFMVEKMRSRAEDARTYKAAWPQTLDQAFVDSHAKMGARLPLADIMADTFAMLFVASLFGPEDYRWEMGYLSLSQTEWLQTEVGESGFKTSAKANGEIETYPTLTRVTYDMHSFDERDYIVCSEGRCLKGVKEARFGRMMRDTVAYDEKRGYDVAFFCLIDPKLPVDEQVGVSRYQASLRSEKLGWVLYGSKESASGVLVVSRQGDRSVVGGRGNPKTSQLLENGDVICFGYHYENGRQRANARLPCYVFQVRADTSAVSGGNGGDVRA